MKQSHGSSLRRWAVTAAFILMVASAGSSLRAAGQQTTKRSRFGSSLKKLRWDQRNNRAVEKDAHKRKKSADKKADTSDAEAIKLSTLLVAFDVLVTDKNGKEISGLTRNDFIVRDEGAAQQIESFSAGESSAIARRVILLIDRSGSERAYLDSSIDAAEELIGQLGPKDQVALIDDSVDLIAGYTADKDTVKKALERIKLQADGAIASGAYSSSRNPYQGRSLQFTALFAALRELMPNDGTLPIVIFQTDGDEAPTLRDQPEADDFIWNMPKRNYGLADILRAAEHSKVTIYSVIPSEPLLGLPPAEVASRGRYMLERMERARFASARTYEDYARTHPLSEAAVKLFTQRFVQGQEAAVKIADLTGGWAAYLEYPDQAASIYSRILSDIRQRYVIGYYPTDSRADGRLHRVKITVKSHPEYVIHGRDSYYAPAR